MEIFLTILMYVLALGGVVALVYMMMKKMDIKVALFLIGIILVVAAMLMGKATYAPGRTAFKAGDILFPIKIIVDEFGKQLAGAGFIILILGGYSAYMTHIGANDVTVNSLTKPLKKIKSPYILVPLVFLLCNILSLVVPSASNLAIILLVTLYPVLRKAGMTRLTAAAVIATTATVMPTPLGADNVAMAARLSADYAIDLSAVDYVFRYHAIISIPTLLVMAAVHLFWQKFQDKKDAAKGVVNEPADEELHLSEEKVIREGGAYRAIYTILPLLPIFLLIILWIVNLNVPKDHQFNLNVGIAVLVSFFAAVICELIFKRKDEHNVGARVKDINAFWNGMGAAMGIVILLVAAGVFVQGLTQIGIMAHLQQVMKGANLPGFVLPLIMVLLTAVIVIISGSGVALFYAMVPVIPQLAQVAGISPVMLSIPMGLAGNLLRAVSPVSAVVMIVAGSTKEEPGSIVKRTAVPMIVGVVFMFILSMLLYGADIIKFPPV